METPSSMMMGRIAANPDKPCRDAELVSRLNGQGDTTESMEITLDILQAHPDVNIIFGANDEMALGALTGSTC